MKFIKTFILSRVSTYLCAVFSAALLMMAAGGCATGGASSQSITEIRQAAEAGDPAAQIQLGDAYYRGRGVPQSYTEAEKWYQKAAEGYGKQAQ